jgi:hypothetical protein
VFICREPLSPVRTQASLSFVCQHVDHSTSAQLAAVGSRKGRMPWPSRLPQHICACVHVCMRVCVHRTDKKTSHDSSTGGRRITPIVLGIQTFAREGGDFGAQRLWQSVQGPHTLAPPLPGAGPASPLSALKVPPGNGVACAACIGAERAGRREFGVGPRGRSLPIGSIIHTCNRQLCA